MKALLIFSVITALLFMPGSPAFAQDSPVQAEATAGKLTFTVTTVTNNSTYSPKNVLAIWIKDANGAFVASCKVMANTRKAHLVKWNASSGGSTVSAITGATLPNHQTHTVIWEGKNAAGTLVADGNYQVWVEYTSTNSASNGNAGPSFSAQFSKGPDTQHITPANASYFQNNVVDWSPSTVGIAPAEVKSRLVSIFPNPVKNEAVIELNLEKPSAVTLNIYTAGGKLVENLLSKTLAQGKHTVSLNLKSSNSSYPKGLYLLEVRTGTGRHFEKFIVD